MNAFIAGNIVADKKFVNREREIRRVVGRILNNGQSTAVIGEPRSGKTSILNYIKASENLEALYGDEKENLLFFYIDSLTLGRQFSPAEFWEHALEPVKKAMGRANSPLKDAYLTCIKEECGNFVLERLFGQLYLTGRRLVLLLDEFDAFLNNDIFHQSEFYGGLRSLASRSKGLVLVIASRQSLSQLNHGTQEFNRTGSPYFNFLNETVLKPFTKKASNKILDQAGERFTSKDRMFIIRLAGGHPYFLQALASELWEIYEDDEMEDAEEYWNMATKEFYDSARATLSDIWRLWSSEMRKAFITVALDELPVLLEQKSFHIPALLKKLSTYSPELTDLERRGFIKKDADMDSGYCVTAGIMLQFVADELLKALRKGDDLGNYFHEERWDGIFTVGEKRQYAKAAIKLSGVLKEGIEIFPKIASLVA